MPVVVDHRDATSLSDHLEAALGAGEGRERGLGLVSVDPDPEKRRERTGRIEAVVCAGHVEREVHRIENPAAHGVGHHCEPRVECVAQLLDGAVGGVVVELDVRHDRELRPQLEHRAVELVSFDDEPSVAAARVPAELRDHAADDPRRVVPCLPQRVGDHPGRRRLPVRARDDDRVARVDELREEGCARGSLDALAVAGRTTTSKPSGGRGSPPRSSSTPSSVSVKIVAPTSQPHTSAPQARAMFAYADMPEPPRMTKWRQNVLLREGF